MTIRRFFLGLGAIVLAAVGFRLATGQCPLACAMHYVHGDAKTAAPVTVQN